MAKMLKQLVFGQKKNPPAPPRPDYEGDKSADAPYDSPTEAPFTDHDYENIPKFKSKSTNQVRFVEKTTAELVVFDNYSEPADLRVDLSTLDSDPLYMSPLDDQGTAPPLEEEDMYCVPYDTPEEEGAPALPQPCLIKGYASHRLGRKAVLMYVSISYTFSWLAIAYAQSMWFVYTGRIVSGFCAGMCFVAVPAYAVEVSTIEIRGLLTAGFQAAFACGLFLMMLMGIFFRWSQLAVAGAAFVVFGASLMVFMPESPPWLIKMGRNGEALAGLKFFRNRHCDAVKEFHEVSDHNAEGPKSGLTFAELFRPQLYKPIAIAVALMFFQQFCGINGLMTYAVELFRNTKSSIEPNESAAIVAFVQLLASVVSSYMMDRAGRRTLYIISGIGATSSLTVSGAYSYFSQKYTMAELGGWSWLPLISFVMFNVFFSLGLGPMPFVVTPELVPVHSRSFLLAVASVSTSLFSFVVTRTFDNLRSAVGLSGTYWIYAGFSFLAVLFYWIFVPETKGRTLQDINNSFKS